MIEYIIFMDWVNILKILVLPNISHWIQCNPNKNHRKLCCRCCQTNSKVHKKGKSQNSQNSIEKEESQRTDATWFKTYRTVLLKEYTNRLMEHNKKPRNRPRQLIFDKGPWAIQWSENSLFNKKCWNKWTSTCEEKNESRHRPYTLHKN